MTPRAGPPESMAQKLGLPGVNTVESLVSITLEVTTDVADALLPALASPNPPQHGEADVSQM